MVPSIPPQRGSCPVHRWCTSGAGRHRAHTSEPTVFTTAEGVVVRVTLGAENGSPPVVQVEVALEPSGTMLELGRFEPREAIALGAVLQRTGRAAQARNRDGTRSGDGVGGSKGAESQR